MDFSWMKEAMPARFEKARRFLHDQDKFLCLGAGYLLKKFAGIETEKEILFSEYGKPYAPCKKKFSISHSSELCAIAISDSEIGLDVEKIEEVFPSEAKMIFTEEERKWAEDCIERLYQLWTMKESVLKAVGMGFYLEPASFSVLEATSQGENTTVKINGNKWQVESWKKDGYSFSVCVKL